MMWYEERRGNQGLLPMQMYANHANSLETIREADYITFGYWLMENSVDCLW